MDTLITELLFILLLSIGLGAYTIGKNKHIDLLRTLGVRSSLIMIVMLVAYNLIKWKKDY